MLLRDLKKQKCIAVDTESNSLYAYYERVCLIQFSTRQQDYILDPLAISSIEPLGQVFADPAIEKVFHAADYDLACLYRQYDWPVRCIFDTMAAARALGWNQVGLAAILQKKFNVASDKRFQRTNWGSRPLSREQLAYAQTDTHYLLPLRDYLSERLQVDGHWESTREEFERITIASLRRHHDLPLKTPDPDGFWRISGARTLNGRQAATLRELYLYQEAAASRLNRAPFRIMGNATLIAIALRNPLRLSDLRGLAGMTPGQISRHGQDMLRAVQRGGKMKPIHPPRPKSVSPAVLARYNVLHEWRKKRARTRGVTSDVILPRQVLWNLARQDPSSLFDLESTQDLGPWRRSNYGEEILNALRTASNE
jgi:ribonuclease D